MTWPLWQHGLSMRRRPKEPAALAYVSEQVQNGMIARAAKYSSMDAQTKSAKRGRQTQPPPGDQTA